MARWLLTKLLHPWTPDDILESRRIVSPLQLPQSTSQFVLALPDPHAPGKVVYLLAVEKLSERSIGDIHALVDAVKPGSVVALVEPEDLKYLLEERKQLEAPGRLDVPTCGVDVIKACFTQKIKGNDYESRAGLRVLIGVFGTTFYGNVLASKQAAGKAQAVFECLRCPSGATSSFSDEEASVDGELVGSARSQIAVSKLSGAERFRSSSLHSRELEVRAPSLLASNLAGNEATLSVSSADSQLASSLSAEELSANVNASCPSFAAPIFPLFVDLHNLFKETQGMNVALKGVRNVLGAVESGDEVDHQDVSRARLFREAVESVRFTWNSIILRERKAYFKPTDFSRLPFEDKCSALLARALRHQAQKFNSVVAIVDASSVAGIRRHWNTPIPTEVAAYAEYCFVAVDAEESDEGTMLQGNLTDNLEEKATVLVSAGAIIAMLLHSQPHWTSLTPFMKIFTFKIPTALKVVWLQMKRQAVVSWASSAATPASKVMMPAMKAAGGSGKAALAQSSSKALLWKSMTTAERARNAAHSVVAAAEKASFQAIRTSFYSVMRNRQTNSRGPRPLLMLGVSLIGAAGVFSYGREVEHAIGIVPSIPAVVRLGRGLENLDRASQKAVSQRH